MSGFSIALVYDLRSEYRALGYSADAIAEFDSEETIDLIAESLARLGHRVTRIGNGRALARCLADGCRYDLVFSIAEGLGGRAREAQVPALCELYGQAYVFSDPLTLALALDKGAAKRVVREAGIATAPFALASSAEVLPELAFDYPVFVKPVAEGTGKGCELASVCHDRAQLLAAVRALHARFEQDVIIEPYLCGREFTVAIVDRGGVPQVAGVLEIAYNNGADAGVYSYRNKEASETLISYGVPDDVIAAGAVECALAAYRALECRDAGRIDIRCDANGQAFFIEANPLAGLHPTHSDLPMAVIRAGHSYDWLLNAIVTSAAERYGLAADTGRARRAQRPLVPVMHAALSTRADELDTLETAELVSAALERSGYASEIVRFSVAGDAAHELARRGAQVVFNLVEAIDGKAVASVLAPWSLERAGLAFTGNRFAASIATASKLMAKGLMLAHGVPTPALIDDGGSYRGAVILKPEWEHGSLGIDAASVVPAANMARELAERSARYQERFFAEAFIAGREFNVAVIETVGGPRVLPIQETLFVDWPDDHPRIVDFDAKWAPDSANYVRTPRRFGLESCEAALAERLGACARQVWTAFGLCGYARIDVRVDAAEQLWVIDINANPGLGPDAGFVAAAAAASLDFDSVVGTLVDAGLRRAA